MRKEMLVAAGALFLAGSASADILLFDIDADPNAWADALQANGKVRKGGWNFDADADYGIAGFDAPLTSAGGGPVSPGTINTDNVVMDVINNSGPGATGLVAVGPSAGFGNPSNAVLANFFTDSFQMNFTSGDKTAVEFNALSLLGGTTVDITVNGGAAVFAGVAAGAGGHNYGILATGGDTIDSVNIFDTGGGAEGIQGSGTVYVPAPGALALLGVAGLVSRRRRR